MIRLLLVVLGFSTVAAVGAAEVPEVATKAHREYNAAIEMIQSSYVLAVGDAAAEYGTKLDSAIRAARESGNLDAVLALKEERERLAKNELGAPGILPADAARARQGYDAAIGKARTAASAKRKEFHAALLRKIADLEKAETRADRLESALALRAYRQELEKAGPPSPAGVDALVEANASKPFGWRNGAEKARLIKAGGGTDQSEAAIARGLDWLVAQQRPSGGWANGSKGNESCGHTGLALLPLLGAGYAPGPDGKYNKAVSSGLKYLLANQKPDGSFTDTFWLGYPAQALCETYGMTQDKLYKEPAQRVINHVVRTQAKDGGWSIKPQGPSYITTTGYNLEAIHAASLEAV